MAAADRAPVTVAAVVDTALRMLEEDGLDALTMRRVATRLGLQAPSLYWHVRGKDELLDLMAEALQEGFDLPAAAQGPTWQDKLLRASAEYRRYLLGRRDAARVLAGRFVAGPAYLRNCEIVLGLLHEAGLPPRAAAYGLHLIITYVQGFVVQESGPMSAQEAQDGRLAALESLRARLHELPEEGFARVRAGADDLTSTDSDGRFAYGIECIIRGLTP
jgi:TetR/AcrR family tetracycline transcriptional repressor